MKRLSCLILLLAACGSPKPSRSQHESPVLVVPPATSRAVHETAAAPERSARPPENADMEPQVDCSDAAFAAAEKELEAAITHNKVDDILKKCDQALYIHTRDVALRNRYMKFLVDRGLDGSEQAQILVAIGDDNNAQAWTVLGLHAEGEKKHELSRAYLARAAAIDPKSNGAVRLGNQSRCTGAFERANADSRRSISLRAGWAFSGSSRISVWCTKKNPIQRTRPKPANGFASTTT